MKSSSSQPARSPGPADPAPPGAAGKPSSGTSGSTKSRYRPTRRRKYSCAPARLQRLAAPAPCRAGVPDAARSAARLQQPRDERRGRHVRRAPQRPAHQRASVLQPPAAARAALSPYPYPNGTMRLREAAAAPPACAHSTTAEHHATCALAAPRAQRPQQRGSAGKAAGGGPGARHVQPRRSTAKRVRAAHPAHGSSSDGARTRPPPPASSPPAMANTEPASRSTTTTPSRSRPASVLTHMPMRKGIGAVRYSCAARVCF